VSTYSLYLLQSAGTFGQVATRKIFLTCKHTCSSRRR